MKRVFKHVIPVDDEWHERHTGEILHVDHQETERGWGTDAVTFWFENRGDDYTHTRAFRVFGTGHPVPDEARYEGTCIGVRGLVWHLYSLVEGEDA